MAYYWFAMRTKQRKEETVCNQLRNHFFEVFYPQLRVYPANPRSHWLKPYFPGYLFVHSDFEQPSMSKLQWMPNTFGLVNFGGTPAAIPDALIAAIRQRVSEAMRQDHQPPAEIKAGDEIKIHSGLFKGYDGIFDIHLPGSERVRVLLKLLNEHYIRLELSPGDIRKKQGGSGELQRR